MKRLGLFVCAALVGCAPPAGPSVARRALQGTADAGDTNVVDITWVQPTSFAECSGSLLAPNLVLTAHHCVANLMNGGPNGAVDCATSTFGAPDKPANFFVSTKEMLSMNPADFHMVSEIVVPPPTGGSQVCGVDLALIILADLVQPSEAVPLVPSVDVAATDGEGYSAIGFGLTGDTANDAGTRRRLDGLAVDCVGADCAATFFGGISTDHEFVGDHGVCEGDSGGPALDADNRVFGAVSRGGANCTIPIYGDVFTWADWIKQTAHHAADAGGYSAPNWVNGWPTDPAYNDPVGAACTDGSGCPSGICVPHGSTSYCTRLCNDASPCDPGFMCASVSGGQVCERIPKPPSGCAIAPGAPARAPLALVALFALALAARRRRA